MKVVFLSINDWANLGYTLSECIQSVGIDALCIKNKNHLFEYPKQGKIVKIKEFNKYIKDADIVQFMHSEWVDVDISGKRVFVFHGGSKYRKDYKKINKTFNPIVEKSIIQTGDLFGLGAKNEVWLLPAVDTENIKPVFMKPDKTKKIIIGHFPSSPVTKNSKGIEKVFKSLDKDFKNKFIYNYSGERTDWNDQMKRISECDIYIDACMPTLEGRKYGEWGINALEASALGKIVISHFRSYPKYKKVYGKECGIVIANSLDQLEKQLRWLLQLSLKELLEIQHQTRQWLEDKHSYKTVSERMKNKIYEI